MTCQSPGGSPSRVSLLALWVCASVDATPSVRTPGSNAVFENPLTPAGIERSQKYLIASFPNLRQVAYVHLPDNVWRPLVIGEVSRPEAIAVDEQNARLFVSDALKSVIWWYKIRVRPDGLLEMVGKRHAAVEGYSASWMAVNGIGDLYFIGHQVVTPPQSPITSVFRQDAIHIATGDSLNPAEVYTRSNTGNPNPRVWRPSGIAVDSFYIYWGNQAQGQAHGALIRGTRMNLGTLSQDAQLLVMNDAMNEVRGVTCTGTHVFFLSPDAVYGVPKGTPTTVHDPNEGLIATAPGGQDSNSRWNPVSIAWDGDNSLYFSDSGMGLVYSLPAQNAKDHNLTKFVDSPNVYGLAIIGFHSGSIPPCFASGVILALALHAAGLFIPLP